MLLLQVIIIGIFLTNTSDGMVCKTSCKTCIGEFSWQCTKCNTGLLQQPSTNVSDDSSFECVSQCKTELVEDSVNARCVNCSEESSFTNSTVCEFSPEPTGPQNNAVVIGSIIGGIFGLLLVSGIILSICVWRRKQMRGDNSVGAKHEPKHRKHREVGLQSEYSHQTGEKQSEARENTYLNIGFNKEREKLYGRSTSRDTYNEVPAPSYQNVTRHSYIKASKENQMVADNNGFIEDSTYEPIEPKVPSRQENEEICLNLHNKIWVQRTMLVRLGVLLTRSEPDRGKVVLEVNSEHPDKIQSELQSLLSAEEYERVEIEESDYYFELENNPDANFYGIHSHVFCLGFGQCSSAGTLGAFVSVNTRPGEANKKVAFITCRHVILCDNCRNARDWTGMQNTFIKDDANERKLVGETHYILEDMDCGIVFLNPYQVEPDQVPKISMFLKNDQSQDLEYSIHTGQVDHDITVQKYGSATDVTKGTIDAFHDIRCLQYDTQNVFKVIGEKKFEQQPNGSYWVDFSHKGDSGAVVTSLTNDEKNEAKVYGMVFGGLIPRRGSRKPKVTLCMDMNPIFQRFEENDHHLHFLTKQDYEKLCYVDMAEGATVQDTRPQETVSEVEVDPIDLNIKNRSQQETTSQVETVHEPLYMNIQKH